MIGARSALLQNRGLQVRVLPPLLGLSASRVVRLLDAGEVAQLLGVPARWVRDHTRSGQIPHVRLGRYVRYDRGEVLAWIESIKRGGVGADWQRIRPRQYPKAVQSGS